MLIFVNNSRPEYSRNLLNSTALPMGGIHTFRFARKWIDPSIHAALAQNTLVSRPIWIAFHEVDATPDQSIPVRSGTVVRTEFSGLLAIIEISVGSFAANRDIRDISNSFDVEAHRRTPYRSRYSIYGNTVQPSGTSDDNVRDWQATAERLAQLGTYRKSSMVYVEGVRKIGADWYPSESDGYRISGTTPIEVVINSLSPSTADPGGAYILQTDPEIIRVIPTPTFQLGFKFNRFTPRVVVVDPSRARLGVLDIEPAGSTLAPEVRLLMRIEPSKLRRFTLYVLPGASALIAALAGVLPAESPLWLRLSMVGIGSVGLAISAGHRR
ncbi:hypothetical protein ACFXP7_05120 [Microbacterium sp. P06]|uniref:hypothetical protein n=1 Tax=Microbacterium sp. P06 TaxID=3366949 RepID=UPI003745935D